MLETIDVGFPARANVGSVTVGQHPVALNSVSLPGGETVYVVDEGANQISVFKPASSAPASGTSASPTAATTPGVATSPTSGNATPSGVSGSPTALASPGASSTATPGAAGSVTTIPVGIKPVAITGVPGGTKLYVANQGSGDISVIDTSTNKEPQRIPVGGHLTGLAISPNGSTLFVIADQPSGHVADVNLSTGTTPTVATGLTLSSGTGLNPTATP